MPEHYGPHSNEFQNTPEYSASSFQDLITASRQYRAGLKFSPPAMRWSDKRIPVEQYLNRHSSPAIEVGGPTPNSYELLETDKLNKDIFTSNIKDGLYVLVDWDEDNDNGIFQKIADVDFVADSANMPLRDASVSAFLASGLPESGIEGGLRTKTILEAKRVLKPGGFLVWQRGIFADVVQAMDEDFEPVRAILHPEGRYTDGTRAETWNVIFRKPLD